MMSATLQSVPQGPLASQAARRQRLVIGLVNNMPDGALETTERQFAELLGAAGGDYDIRLRLFSFPELIRRETGRTYVAEHYESIDELWTGEFDGLIVTGAEPRTRLLSDEVYWPSLTRLVDLASSSSMPTVWSCLAAHAAVLHLDGIQRSPLDQKISGVFRCTKTGDDALASGLPPFWRIPHSRHNALGADRLQSAGYQIVSFSEEAGADTFILRRQAPFVFYQGHPEYDPGALFREYRRDVGRFLDGSLDRYPDMPRGYFTADAARAFAEYRVHAQRRRSRELLEQFPKFEAHQGLVHAWRDTAVCLYSNWLRALASRTGSNLRRRSAATIVETRVR